MSQAVQAQKFRLSGSGTSASASSITLTSFAILDGTLLTMTDFGSDVGYMTLEPGTAREESIKFTGITQNGNGTATLTGCSRGLRFVSPFDVVAGNQQAHAGGSIAILSNTSAFYSEYVDIKNAQTIAGIKTFSSIPVLPASNPTSDNQAARKAYVDLFLPLTGGTVSGAIVFGSTVLLNAAPTLDLQAATKKYADDLAIAGAPDASTTVKGIVEEATSAEIIAGTAAGATGARLFINPTAVAETGADKIVKTKSTGKIDSSVLPVKFGGTGADGALAISSGTTTIDLGSANYVEKNYSSISITGTGQLAFSNPHANGTIIVLKSQGNVTLTSSANPCIDARGMGSAAGAAASGTTTPTNATAALTTDPFHSVPANSGATQASRPTVFDPVAFQRNIVLAPGVGGGGGGDYVASNGRGGPGGASLVSDGGAPGSGGGNTGAGSAGAGGRGGAALLIECAGTYSNTGATISVAGLAGLNSTAGEGAGGGGGGGTLILLSDTIGSDTGTYTVSGGAKGTGSNSVQDGGTGGNGYSYVGINKVFS